MAKYITYREDENGAPSYYILQKEFPHFVGRVVDNPYFKSIVNAPVPQTKLYVAMVGTLRGNAIPSYQNILEEIKIFAIDMAYWYFENRILPNPQKFKKWLSTQPSTT
jgi:hypothetical protein